MLPPHCHCCRPHCHCCCVCCCHHCHPQRQVGADKGIQIANFLCPGNYAVSGSIEGCEAVERLGKDPAFKARMTVRGRQLRAARGAAGHQQPLAATLLTHPRHLNTFVDTATTTLHQVRLAVAGAFHTQYMAPAAEKLQEALNNTAIVCPRIPVISNVDAAPHSDPAVIKAILAKQVGGWVVLACVACVCWWRVCLKRVTR
jgi:[acyl-carrier-protein] S-malonyltransferase